MRLLVKVTAFSFFCFLIASCIKDTFENPEKQPLISTDAQARETSVSIVEARQWFAGQYGLERNITNQNTISNLTLSIKPVWAFAKSATYLGNSVVICPIQPITLTSGLTRYFLVFYKTSSSNIEARLILCRGVNDYLTNGHPFEPSSFSGIVAAMDFSGNYSGALHLIRNGAGVGSIEIIPSGNTGGITPNNLEPTWLGGDVWFDGNTIWIGGFDSGPGPFPSDNPIINNNEGHNGGGGGNSNTNTGSSLVDFHFTNLFSNPLFIIEEYMLDNNMNNTDAFFFLNTSNRQFLANYKDFIDIFYDFLTSHNNSSEARDIINKVIEIILNTNVSAKPNFQAIVTSWLSATTSQYIAQHSARDLIDIYNAVENNNVISPDVLGPLVELPGDLDNCFDNNCTGCTHKVTVYIEQPVPGTRELWSIRTNSGGSSGSSINAGHTFLSLEQTAPNGNKTTVTLGFYPINKNHSCAEIPGAVYEEDLNTVYNVSVSWGVSLENFKKIRDGWNNWQSPSPFSNCYRNCTSAAIYCLNQGGLNIPSTSAGYQFPIGTFTVNPADLGEDLHANPQGGTLSFSTQVLTLTGTELSNCH